MKLSVLALDYDGTIARDDRLDPTVREAIAQARGRGVKVMLVTGRTLDDLQRVAGELSFVDGVVAENGALVQFLKDVSWGELDVLLLDLPPGTGDVALTLSQKLRSSGAVIVTTPQEVALQDVYKSVSMAEKVGIPVLGVVENESYFVCNGCEKRHELFGSGGGQKIADFARAPLLGQIPLDGAVREWGDAGVPIVEAQPGSSVGKAFVEVAERLVEELRGRSGGGVVCWGRGMSGRLGNGSNANQTTPVAVSGLSDAVAIATGGEHTCALRTTGEVACWGAGGNGRLGDGGTNGVE